MPIGIVSDEEFEDELNGSSKETGSARVEQLRIGRGSKNETPESLRKVISETAITEGNQAAKDLVKSLGGEISQSSISAYKKGATSTATIHEPDKELLDFNKITRNKITRKARLVALAALTEITPEKLKDAKLRDISGVARDMSGIIKDMDPSVDEEKEARVQFVMFMPSMREEKSFEIIDVKD